MQKVISFTNFEKGYKYEEFNSSNDKVAEYGIAALVLGGIAAKTGLFKVLLGLLIAGKKFIIMGAVAIGGFFMKFFKRNNND